MAGSLAAVWLCLGSSSAAAQTASGRDPSDETRRIAQELQCPICEGLSVADSPSQLAVGMRGVIREKVEAGETRDQILAYFVDRYGENILMEPPRNGFTTIAWVAPYIALLATLAFLGWKLRRRKSSATVPAIEDASLDPYLEEVDRTYDAVRDEAIR